MAPSGLKNLWIFESVNSLLPLFLPRVTAPPAMAEMTARSTPTSAPRWRSLCSPTRRTGRSPSCWLPSCTWGTCSTKVQWQNAGIWSSTSLLLILHGRREPSLGTESCIQTTCHGAMPGTQVFIVVCKDKKGGISHSAGLTDSSMLCDIRLSWI